MVCQHTDPTRTIEEPQIFVAQVNMFIPHCEDCLYEK